LPATRQLINRAYGETADELRLVPLFAAWRRVRRASSTGSCGMAGAFCARMNRTSSSVVFDEPRQGHVKGPRGWDQIRRRSQALAYRPNVGTIERWGSVALGSALIAYGITRQSRAGVGITAAGTTLALRGATGRCPVYSRFGITTAQSRDTRVALAGDRGFRVHEGIRLEKPLEEVYRFWRRLENLPQFMAHLAVVTDLGNGRSHWVAKGPAGLRVEWDADIINEVENKVIGWRSLPNSDLITAGSVNFDRVRGGRSTQVTVTLQYAPPGGRVGRIIAQLFGDEPSQAIREDLRRQKWLLEAGEIPLASEAQIPGGWRI
jgi:uncharacterized membrane protein